MFLKFEFEQLAPLQFHTQLYNLNHVSYNYSFKCHG